MIPKQAIEKAREGGYEIPDFAVDWEFAYPKIALDPAFWQALGRALGWKDEFMFTMEFNEMPRRFGDLMHANHQQEWLYWAIRFQTFILTGGDTEKFWSGLLEGKNLG